MKVLKSNVASFVLATLLSTTTLSVWAQGLDTRVISGTVSDGENPIANVAVTDGQHIVTTDENGFYSISTPVDSRFVYITTPAGYVVSVKDKTIPQFYQLLEGDKTTYDFKLTKNKHNDDKHTFVVHSDVQVTSTADIKQYKTVVEDCRKTIDGINGDVFGIDCGDIVGDSPFLYPNYIDAVSDLEIPMYRAIGNHDMDYYGRSHETSYHTFEKYFGPTVYSFNKGKAHYIVLNNNFFIGRDYFYMGYVDEKTFAWLEQDLALVPKDNLIFIVMHIPSQLTNETQQFKYDYFSIADQTVNARALHQLFKSHETHIITGHMHYNLNMEFGDKIMEHNTASACGTWWQIPECLDGTPRGYAVYEVDQNQVEWYYKGAEYDRNYQMRVYGVGQDDDFPTDVVVNVWNYDSKWKVELFEDGKKTADMTKFSGYDQYTKILCSDRSKVKYDWIYPTKNGHMFRATPKNPNAKLQVKVTDRFGNIYTQDINPTQE